MLMIPCPWCGTRAEDEFSYGGQARVVRPTEPGKVSDAAWSDYLYLRDNPKGFYRERWCHSFGCGQWFIVVRDTVSHRIAASHRLGEPEPPLSELSDG